MTAEPQQSPEDWRRRAGDLLGTVVGAMPHSEPRPGQARMTDLVATSFAERRHLVIEAGTGTGKSLGYLVPAVCAGLPVVVSTKTKALQNQVADSDLPLVAAATGEVSYAVLKGRNNYVCLQKLDEALDDTAQQFEGFGGEVLEELRQVRDWCTTERIAEIERAPFPLSREAATQLAAGTDECPGRKSCPRGNDCHAERARDRARGSSVIVVNHSLLAMALATAEPAAVVPLGDYLVVDEAHELEDAIADALTIEMSGAVITSLMKAVTRFFEKGKAPRALFGIAEELDKAIAAVKQHDLPDGVPPRLSKVLTDIRSELSRLVASVDKVASANPAAQTRAVRLRQRVDNLTFSVTTLLGDDDEWVRHVTTGRRPELRATPLNIGSFLRENLWPVCTAVLTSATIPTNIVERLSIPSRNVRVEKVDSPFDYANNALLFVPRGLPDTGDRTAAVNPVILELMEATGGRTLALFTSFAAMESAAAYCRQHSRIPVLLQNEAPASELAQRFADDEATSLFATRTFFQGVDIPGRTLSLVIIDKLPFPSPADPVLKARRAQIGPAAFQELDVVMCATDLAQAAGRLIRRTTDTGMVAVLDGRLLTKNYGPTLIASLPPMHRTDDRGVALAFLREIAAG